MQCYTFGNLNGKRLRQRDGRPQVVPAASQRVFSEQNFGVNNGVGVCIRFRCHFVCDSQPLTDLSVRMTRILLTVGQIDAAIEDATVGGDGKLNRETRQA